MDWGLYLSVIVGSVVAGVAIFWLAAGYYHVRYYVLGKDEPERWKLQPKRMPTQKQQRKAMRLSTFNLVVGGLISGHFVWGLMNGLPTPMYFDVAEYGWAWTLAGVPVLFFCVDGAAYYSHRFLHTRPMYVRFHKLHHRWASPSPWVAVAVHPVEFLVFQAATFLPLLVLPVHAGAAIFVFIYVLVFNIADHSGVRLRSIWPWQGPSAYHDDHHVHFHVNFGQHLMLFDKLHGTLRREKRTYGVRNYGGKGAPTEDEGTKPEFVKY